MQRYSDQRSIRSDTNVSPAVYGRAAHVDVDELGGIRMWQAFAHAPRTFKGPC